MPLHLLGKKSWNVYNTVNIEKVKRDEAAAAALEAAEEERMQEADAQRRMQILRGETPTPLAIEEAPRPSDSNEDGSRSAARENGSGSGYGYGRERKRRKKAGENDTDFEMRMFAEERQNERDVDKQLVLRKPTEAPLVDQRGNISLFPETVSSITKAEKNPEAEREAARKKKEYEDQYTMRFSNAAGFKQSLESPWYSMSKPERSLGDEEREKDRLEINGREDFGGEIIQRDVWGNEDPMRKERVLNRMVANDPLAMMKAGARQVRMVEKERKLLREEREKEMRELEDMERKRRRERRRERDELEGFRLDEPVRDEDSERRRKRKRRYEDEGSDDGELDESRLDSRARTSSSRHEGRRESEKDRGRRHRHKESRRSSHRDEGRHKHRHRSKHHDYD